MATVQIECRLGPENTGLTLNGKFYDTTGNAYGAYITDTFIELGNGDYYVDATIPDGYVSGYLEITNASGGAYLAAAVIDSVVASTVSVVITPVAGVVSASVTGASDLQVDQYTAPLLTFSLVDASGNAVYIPGHDVRFILFKSTTPIETIWSTESGPSSEVTVSGSSGSSGSVVTVQLPGGLTDVSDRLRYALRDLTNNNQVLAKGSFIITPLPLS